MKHKIKIAANRLKIHTLSGPLSRCIKKFFRPLLRATSFIVNPAVKRLEPSARIIKHRLNRVINRLGRRHIKWICFGFSVLAVAAAVIGLVAYERSLIAASYRLPVAEQALIGQPDKSLLSQFTYDAKTHAYYLSKSAINKSYYADPNASPVGNSITVGGSSTNNAKFSLKLPTNASQGITTYDNTSGLSFTMIPLFSTFTGKQVYGHTVYPTGFGGTKAVYTVKADGVQEDVIYAGAPKGSIKLQYKLKLPNALQARMMPGGNLGIYSANPYLFGNITYGSSADEQKVMTARKKSPKNNLVFVLPAPRIITPSGTLPINGRQHIKLALAGDILTVTASGLGNLPGPISIDPSVVVTSATDFMNGGNNENDITFDSTNAQITEAGLNGGTIGSWASTTSFSGASSMPARADAGAVAYNGNIYVFGGVALVSGGDCTYFAGGDYYCNGVWYDSINSNGTIGSTWNPTTFFPATTMEPRQAFGYAVYDGYLYVTGGEGDGVSGGSCSTGTFYLCSDTWYALICNGSNFGILGCSNTAGTIGTWTKTQSWAAGMPARFNFQTVAYKGYLYVIGGAAVASVGDCTTTDFFCKGIWYDSFNADGTIGSTWNEETATFTAGTMPPRIAFGATVYNGYLYVLGGESDTSGGDCTSSEMPSLGAPYYACSGVWYDSINANGTIGSTWIKTTSFSNTTYIPMSEWFGLQAVAYNGYLYAIGGDNIYSQYGNGLTFGACLDYIDCGSDFYIAINSDGTLGGIWDETQSFSNSPSMPGRDSFMAVAYNGHLYVLGGYSSMAALDTSGVGDCVGAADHICNGVWYATINPAGVLDDSGWDYLAYENGTGTSYNFNYARINLGAVAYNGYLYIMGGLSGSTYENDVQYTAVDANGDGAISAPSTCAGGRTGGSNLWCEATAFTTGRQSFSVVAYNGYMYIMGGIAASSSGGCMAIGNNCNDVQYDTINTDGSLGSTWADDITLSTGAFTNARSNLGAVVYNGYLYIMGGEQTNTISYTSGSGNWNAPTGVSSVQAEAWGAGGGGANGIGGTTGGGAGGGGEYAMEPSLAVTAGNNYAYAVGAGGGGGSNGTNGGNSTFVGNSVTVTAHGGSGGQSGTGGTDGTGSTNTVHYNGGSGGRGIEYSGGAYGGGGGGSGGTAGTGGNGFDASIGAGSGASAVSGGGPGGNGGTAGAVGSSPISGPGGGGGGGGANTGGTGYAGKVRLTWVLSYYNDIQYAALNSNGSLAAPSTCPGGWATGNTIWCEATAFTTARQGLNAIAYNNYLYILGGQAGSSTGGCMGTSDYCNDVQYDSFNTNGSLGSTWADDVTLSTGAFTTPRSSFGAFINNGYLYITSGIYNLTLEGDTQFAALGTNGAISEPSGCPTLASGNSIWCKTNGTANSSGFNGFATVDYNGYVYLFGGNYPPDGGITSWTLFCAINNGGTGIISSAWTATGSLPTATDYSTSVAYNGYLYEIGGTQTVATATVDYAAITTSGTLASPGTCAGTLTAPWCASTSTGNGSLPSATYQSTSAVYNGYIYEIGGWTTAATNAVYYAAINSSTGAVGTWTGTGSLPTSTYAATSAVYNGYLYEIGGYTTAATATVNYAAITTSGTLASPGTCAGTLTAPWCASTSTGNGSLPNPTYQSTSAVYNGYLYEIGGTSNGSTINATVYYAPINSNTGAVGTWTGTSSLPAGTYVATSVAYNGYIYEIGGYTTASTTMVDQAAIANNGAVGAWTTTTSLPLSTQYATSVAYNGFVYEIGGFNSGTTKTTTVDYAGLHSIPRVGFYSRMIDITGMSGDDPNPIEIQTDGGDCSSGACSTNYSNPGTGGISGPGGIIIKYRFASNACTIFNTLTTLPTGLNLISAKDPLVFTTDGCSNSTSLGRYAWVSYQLDDSQTASFPDATGNHTSITDFTLYYHSASNYRLRGGATFTFGALQSLDAP